MEFPADPNHFPNTVSGIGTESTSNKNEVYKKSDLVFTKPLKPLQPSLFKETEISMERTNLMNQLQGIQERKQDLILKDMMEKLEFQRQQEKVAKLNAMLNNYYFTTFLDELQDKIKLSQNKRLDDLQKEMLETNEESQKINQNLMTENQKKSAEYWNLRQQGKTHEEILTMREKEKPLSMKKEEISAETGEKVKKMMAQMMERDILREEEESQFLEELERTIREEYEEKIEKIEEDKMAMIDEAQTEATYMATFLDKDVKPFNKKLTPILNTFENHIDVLDRYKTIDEKLSLGQSVDKVLSKKMLNNLAELTNKIFNTEIELLKTESKKGTGDERRDYFSELKEEINEIQQENNFNLDILQEGQANLEQLILTKQDVKRLKGLRPGDIKEEIEDRLRNLGDYKELYPFQFGLN